MRVLLVVFVVSMSACGEERSTVSSALAKSCALASGTYVSEATLRSKEGTCPFEKPYTRDRLEFDEGAYVSPAAVFIPCRTEQVECALTINCKVLDLDMVFTGELIEDANGIVGSLTFTGEGNCKSAIYDLVATRPAP